jgi:stage VI sporulation protein D
MEQMNFRGDNMTEQQSGLRFDIYERVHLADDQPAMRSLDSIELVPHIQVMAEGEQALLKGNLRLAGHYYSELDEETRSLEHWIPVEITLPLNRVHRLEDIAVEIENFDIDLLSSRLINVTGVLSLRGLDTIPLVQDWQSEESSFLNEALEERVSQPQLIPLDPENETFVGYETVAGDGTRLESVEAEELIVDEAVNELPAVFEMEIIQPENAVIEDKKELKVAFGSKPTSAQEHLLKIKNLLPNETDGKRLPFPSNGSGETHTEAEREGMRGDELEWKKLFLGERGNDRLFKKVRLCIVQKEETIDGIAERYSLNPREIMLFNRLSSYQVAVGQVIYIP